MTDHDPAVIRSWYEDEGLGVRAIARRLGISIRQVYRIMDRLGIPRRPPGYHLGPIIITESQLKTLRRYAYGIGVTRTARLIQVDRAFIRPVIGGTVLHRRNDRRVRPDQWKDVLEAARAGVPQAELAARYGCSPRAIRRYLRLARVRIVPDPPDRSSLTAGREATAPDTRQEEDP